ncbi:AmmeMemoRadiSam system protein B [Verrucomicrobiota bacterium]
MAGDTERTVRRAKGSGRWFPGSRRELAAMIDGFMESADVPSVEGRIVAAVSPHAGYVYSGAVAGYVFRAIQENAAASGAPETVVVLGLSHRGAFRGVALMDGDSLETPLGEAVLDGQAGRDLAGASSRIFFDITPHAGEHSAENQVPFVQRALPKAKLVVGIIGDHDGKTLEELVDGLAALAARKRILVVASTDLLHDPDHGLVTRTDRATLEKIVGMDRKGLEEGWSSTRQTCCGICPVLAAIGFSRSQGSDRGVLLHYRNSGDDFPESRGNWVVGYGAVVFPAGGSD